MAKLSANIDKTDHRASNKQVTIVLTELLTSKRDIARRTTSEHEAEMHSKRSQIEEKRSGARDKRRAPQTTRHRARGKQLVSMKAAMMDNSVHETESRSSDDATMDKQQQELKRGTN